MTTVAVLATPPREGLVLSTLAEETPLSTAETADLYAAMLKDVCRAVETSGGDLLVNYRTADSLPETHDSDQSPAAEVRATVRPALDDPDEARFEKQVGSTFASRVGNTVTHLLEEEDVKTVAAVEPTALFMARQVVDNAAMKLRRHDVVLGPVDGGRVYYAGFGAPVDFENAYAEPAIRTLAGRAADADLSVDFLPMAPVLENETDLVTVLSQIDARERAEHPCPEHTAGCLAEFGLDVVEREDGLAVVRE